MKPRFQIEYFFDSEVSMITPIIPTAGNAALAIGDVFFEIIIDTGTRTWLIFRGEANNREVCESYSELRP